MKIIGINGSPRRNANTGILLKEALKGAALKGYETEMIQLYDYSYTGCRSCFACKLIGGKSYGKCGVIDGISHVLEKIKEADGIILGTPIYLGSITGEMKSFLERLIFPYLVYDKEMSSIVHKRIPVGLIYTLGATEKRLQETTWKEGLKYNEFLIERFIGNIKSMFVTDTYQFDDYSKYVSSAFDEKAKLKRREEEFPKDCNKALELGENLI